MANWVRARLSDSSADLLSILLAVVSLAISFNASLDDRARPEPTDKTLEERLREFDRVEDDLRGLLGFVENQRSEIAEAAATVEELTKERDALEPIVRDGRRTVEAILEIQQRRQSRSAWIERGYGFGIGVLASLLASWIVARIATRKSQSD